MNDQDKTKDQLLHELTELRRQVVELQAALSEHEHTLQENERLIRQESEDRFQTAFRTSPDCINVNRLSDGLYVDINEGFTAMTGFTAADVIGKTSEDIGIWANMEDRERLVQGLRATGHVRDLEALFRFKDGKIHIGLMSARIIQFGGELCILSISRDITEQKRLEAESRKAEILNAELKKEKEIIALKERFISTVSHEFRSPLSVIKMSSDLLNRYFDKLPVERRQQLVQQIAEQIIHMTDLIDDTLDLTRAQAGKIELNPSPLDLEPFCHALFDQTRFADNCNHQFEFISHAPDQPVKVDGQLLRHILTNLFSNAVKYTPNNARISFELDHHEGEVIFRITDEGIGIPEKDQARLFEPFHRADNVENIKGTGLGLAIVKQYVELHGGRIKVDSQEGKGSTFTVLLPLA